MARRKPVDQPVAQPEEPNPYQQLVEMLGAAAALKLSSVIGSISTGHYFDITLSGSDEIILWAEIHKRTPTGAKVPPTLTDFYRLTAIIRRLYHLNNSTKLQSEETVHFS